MACNLGNDVILGEAGVDALNGGLGEDVLSGGAGRDTFQFAGMPDGTVDIITDFTQGLDNIRLSGQAFSALGRQVDASESAFGSVATSAEQKRLFDQNGGALY